MSAHVQASSDSARAVQLAVKKLVQESERTLRRSVAALEETVGDTQAVVQLRERRVSEASRNLAAAETALQACLVRPRANCTALSGKVREQRARLRSCEGELAVAKEVLGKVRSLLSQTVNLARQVGAEQSRLLEGASRATAKAASDLEAYAAGSPVTGAIKSAVTAIAVIAEVATTAVGVGQLAYDVSQGHLLDSGHRESISEMEERETQEQQQLWRDAEDLRRDS